MFFSYSGESGVIYLFQHLGLLISHSPGSFFQDSAVGSLGEAGILHKPHCYQYNSHSYQMCNTDTTKGTQAEGASPALSGCSEMCSRVAEGIRERRAPSTSGLCTCKKMFLFWQNGGAFSFPSSTIPAPPSQGLSPCKPGTAEKACLLETGSPSLHLLPSSYLWDEAPGCRLVKESDCPWQLIVRGNRACDFAFKFNHTHRQHPGSMRGFHGDRMQAMTSVNVIRALGLVCETGLISPSVEALWSRPYIGFIC